MFKSLPTFAIALLIATTPALAADQCNFFSDLMTSIREHQFKCEGKSDRPDHDCTFNTPKITIPDADCTLMRAFPHDREYLCEIKHPSAEVGILWLNWNWYLFRFCASNGLLAERGAIQSDSTRPSFLARIFPFLAGKGIRTNEARFLVYKTERRSYTVAVDKAGPDLWQFRMALDQ